MSDLAVDKIVEAIFRVGGWALGIFITVVEVAIYPIALLIALVGCIFITAGAKSKGISMMVFSFVAYLMVQIIVVAVKMVN